MEKNKALNRLMAYCARAEKCTADALKKMQLWKVAEEDKPEILKVLLAQKFIDNQRYAIAFVKDKNRFNGWGITKIRYHLSAKNIPNDQIEEALKEIDEEGYQEQFYTLMKNKFNQLQPIEDWYTAKAKLVRFGASRGYDPQLIFSTLDKIKSEEG